LARGPARARHQILVVDDHPIVRQGLRRLIDQQRDLEVCGEAESLHEAEAAIRKLKPALVIIDISLKQGDGIELVKEARTRSPNLPILVLSMHDEAIYAERVLAAGANGYIMKQADAEELLLALRRVLGGGIYVSEAIGNSMIRKLTAGGRYVASNPIERLSNRELQILQLIGSGLSTRQAAEALELSMKTIETHRERIKRKLHLATGSQLVQYAVNWSEKVDVGAA
jgi:DNA-binding NarL/FixJ family response regulator